MNYRVSKNFCRRRLFPCISSAILIAAAFILYRYIVLNQWIASDSGQLTAYRRVLIKDELPLFESDPSPDSRTQMIERAIVRASARDRIVLNLSRSQIRHNLFHTKAYVKVFLKTAIPKDRSKSTSIKFLNVLVKKGDTWRVQTTQDLSIE